MSKRSVALVIGGIPGVERDLHGTNATAFMSLVRLLSWSPFRTIDFAARAVYKKPYVPLGEV
jgi:hypothetical protein